MEKLPVNIKTEYIRLDQLLKFSGAAESGADAKSIILSGMVSVNGEVCSARGRKIRAGDAVKIEFEDETVEISVGGE